jgi:hypothetical protein
MNKPKPITSNPGPLPILSGGIKKIALSFSGGGFKAASFTLGCASYFNHIHYQNEPLLNKVKFIASASGGSFTNLFLCYLLRKGKNFKEIYDRLIEKLTGTVLIDRAMKILGDNSAWKNRPDKTRNLINSFAIAYDQSLFEGGTFTDLRIPQSLETFMVDETCINATEFDNGLNFRWQTGGIVGNKYLKFKDHTRVMDKIKLGDILASSSCFPGGFEPIMFPQDFSWQGNENALTMKELQEGLESSNLYNLKETKAYNEDQKNTFGLMDGGIDDNQGIYAFELADDRDKGNFDLYFPCDVTSNFLDQSFIYPEEPQVPLFKNDPIKLFKKIRNGFMGYILVIILGIILASYMVVHGILFPFNYLLLGIFCSSFLIPLITFIFLKINISRMASTIFDSQIKSVNSPNSLKNIFNKYKSDILKQPLNRLISMVMARLNSLLLLATTIFLKRIRQLSYNELFSSRAVKFLMHKIDLNNIKPGFIDTESLWANHIGASTVYQLSTRNQKKLKEELGEDKKLLGQKVSEKDTRLITHVLLSLSEKLMDTADTATHMETTLWFDEHQEELKSRENLIATGQATTCFNLIKMAYLFGNTDQEWVKLKEDLLSDWMKFQENPFWLL